MSGTRELFCNTAASRIGYPYIWGARGAEAFDCCGLVEWSMKTIGRPFLDSNGKEKDIRSADLLEIFHKNKVIRGAEKIGSLYLYSNKQAPAIVSHVTIYFRQWKNGKKWLVGANGGNSKCINEDVAYNSGAKVQIVKDDYRLNDLLFIVDPFLNDE